MKNKEIEELLKEMDLIANHNKVPIYFTQSQVKTMLSYIEQLEEDNEYLKRLCETQNNREYRSKFLKEFQKEKGKNVYPDYDEIYKRYYEIKLELQEAIESITWWQNRYNAVERDKKQLENNRDKAIELLDRMYTDFEVMDSYNILSGDKEKLINILKGGSDDK